MVELVGKSLNAEVMNSVQLKGVTVSLNMKNCKWFLPPSQDPRLKLDTDSPTVKIPDDARRDDLDCIFLKLKAGHFVIGDSPIEEFTKNPESLQGHLNMIQHQFSVQVVKDHINSIVNGNNNDNGYSKIEILEAMLKAEEINPATGKGGRNRPDVVKYLREAIHHVEDVFGGVSSVKREEIVPARDGSSGRTYPEANVNSEKARKILGM